MELSELLTFAVKSRASDLHLSSGLPPLIRIDGDIKRINVDPFSSEVVHSMLYDLMNDNQRKSFEEFLETDFSACRAKEKLAQKRNKSNASPQRSPLSFLNLGEPSDPPSPPSQPSLLEESFAKL